MRSTCLVIVCLLHLLAQLVTAQVIDRPCTTPNFAQGVCIDIRQCPLLLNLVQTQGLVAAPFLRQSLCEFTGSNPIVCCPVDSRNNYGNNEGKGLSETSYGPLLPPICGSSNTTHTKIVGGIPSKLGAWPWITALGYRNTANPSQPRWLCGGSLISARHVLTAAHCAVREDLYVVRIGDLDLNREDDGASPVEVAVQRRILHPNYSQSAFVNDIAVLRLAEEVPFSAYISPICLPVEEPLRSRDFFRTYPFVAGWGANATRGPSTPHLQEVQLPVVSTDSCKQAYSLFRESVIDDRTLCAGFARGGKDACQGDSGGPLMLPSRTSYYQIGVVSYGFKCAEPGFPGVYSRVTHFMDFILNSLT